MYIYYDPKTKIIEAIYSARPNSQVWPDKGFILTNVPDNMQPWVGKEVVLRGKKVVDIVGERRVQEPEGTERERKVERLEGVKFSDLETKDKDDLLEYLLSRSGLIGDDEKIKIGRGEI